MVSCSLPLIIIRKGLTLKRRSLPWVFYPIEYFYQFSQDKWGLDFKFTLTTRVNVWDQKNVKFFYQTSMRAMLW